MTALLQVHRALDLPTEEQISWLLGQGISGRAMIEPWPIRKTLVRFLDGNTFDFDGCSPEQAIIFQAVDCGECFDLIGWTPRAGKLGSWCGAAFALGQDQIFNPASWFGGSALRIHATPLEWLKADRDGICIVKLHLTYAMLRHVPRLAFANAAHARTVRAWMNPPSIESQFFVEERLAA